MIELPSKDIFGCFYCSILHPRAEQCIFRIYKHNFTPSPSQELIDTYFQPANRRGKEFVDLRIKHNNFRVKMSGYASFYKCTPLYGGYLDYPSAVLGPRPDVVVETTEIPADEQICSFIQSKEYPYQFLRRHIDNGFEDYQIRIDDFFVHLQDETLSFYIYTRSKRDNLDGYIGYSSAHKKERREFRKF